MFYFFLLVILYYCRYKKNQNHAGIKTVIFFILSKQFLIPYYFIEGVLTLCCESTFVVPVYLYLHMKLF